MYSNITIIIKETSYVNINFTDSVRPYSGTGCSHLRPHRSCPRHRSKGDPGRNCPGPFASLAAAMPGNTLSASAANDLISQIHEQKAIIAPDVPPARLPCGRTADFLPEDLNRTDDGLFEERNRLLKSSANRPGRNGHGSCRSGRSGNYKTLYGLRVHGRIRVRKGNCLRRTLKNWKVTVHGHSIPAHCSGILPQ